MVFAASLEHARKVALLWTLITVIVAVGLTYIGGSTKKVYGVVLGKDKRLSTSKAVAAAWTVVVSYILYALIAAWPSDWEAALKNLSPTYLLLLGGPYASLVLSKLATSTRIDNGTLSKPPNEDGARLSDLVSDDSGDPDLFDMQFVIFNAIAIIFVLVAFKRATIANGFPEIPDGMLILTGGPAAIYLSNKFFGSSGPVVERLIPEAAPVGTTALIRGKNLLPVGNGAIEVRVGSIKSTGTSLGPNAIQFVVPDLPQPELDVPSVVAVTISNSTVYLESALTVTSPTIELYGASVGLVRQGATVTLYGRWPTTPSPPVVSIDSSVIAVAQPGYSATSLTFQMPALVQPLARSVPVKLRLGDRESNGIVILVNA